MLIDPAAVGGVTETASGRRFSGVQLHGVVETRAERLASTGLAGGDVVLVLHANSLDFLADLLAIWRLGACAACVDPGLSERELASIVATVRPRLALVAAQNSATPTSGLQTLCLQDETAAPSAPRVGPPTVRPLRERGAQPALILFTSGTTAAPRAVVHSYCALRARLSLNVRHIGRANLRRTLCVLPTHFGHGLIGNCLTPLRAGGELFLCKGAGLDVAARLGSMIDEHRATFLSSVPALWRMALRFADAPRFAPARVHVGSAPLTAELWRAIQSWCGTLAVVNAYGLTEAANWVAGASGADYTPEQGLIGKLWGGRAAVLDENGELHNAGRGELLIKTPSLMRGYHGEPQLSAAAMHLGWYRAGDLAELATDGTLRLGARLGLAINCAGIKIHPQEIESMLELHPAVRTACAFAVPDAFGGESVGCAVALVEDATVQPAELTQWCAQRIRRNAIPQRWWILTELPFDGRGKMQRREIAQRCLQAKDKR